MEIPPLPENLTISDLDDLDSLYAKPGWVAYASEIDHINAQYRAFIELAPFVTVATNGQKGVDCSARGGETGFVRIRDERTLILPDRPGNNRIDSLHNLLHDPSIALLFLIPGCRETLRVKGRAAVARTPEAIQASPKKAAEKPPKCAIVIAVESVHFQCAGAIKRAHLWDTARQTEGEKLPSANGILAGIKWHGLRRALRLPSLNGWSTAS